MTRSQSTSTTRIGGAPAARVASGVAPAARVASGVAIGVTLAAMVCLLCAPPSGPSVALAEEASAEAKPTGRLEIGVIDAATGRPTPARLEVIGADGTRHVPDDAPQAPGRCPDGSEPAWYTAFRGASALPPFLRIAAVTQLEDPTTKGEQVYALEGRGALSLPPGRYRVTALKGLEYTPRAATVVVESGMTTHLDLLLERFVDMPAEGWFSSDDHIHIARPDAGVNTLLARWMAAEDLHVANLLEMGTFKGSTANQYAFGNAGLFELDGTILAAGQENPRTWTIGHGIILGAKSYIDPRDQYLVYRVFWEEAARQGALSGYAHWGAPGWPLDLPSGHLDFLEVLQVGKGIYDDLYMAWNLGYPIAPTAGSDYQCWISGPPGRVRFYTKVDAPLTYEKWLAALEKGRTFVSNGPFLEFRAGRTEIGGTLALAAAGDVPVEARVRFDPGRDEVEALEVVRNGEVVRTVDVPTAPGVFELRAAVPVQQPSWLAARVRGKKVGDLSWGGVRQASVAHTGAIRVSIAGETQGAREPRRQAAARALQTIDKLEKTLVPMTTAPAISETMNQFDAATLRRDWPSIQKEIETVRRHYEEVQQEAARDSGSAGPMASTAPAPPR